MEKKKRGRKTLKEEMEVLERYNQLAPKVFSFVQQMFNGDNLEDKKWAADWVKGAYARMIPQKIGGDPNNKSPIPVLVKFVNGNESENNRDSNRV